MALNADEVIAKMTDRMRRPSGDFVTVSLFGGDIIYPDEVRRSTMTERLMFYYKGKCICLILPCHIEVVW